MAIVLPHEFHDGVGEVASGVQVDENFAALVSHIETLEALLERSKHVERKHLFTAGVQSTTSATPVTLSTPDQLTVTLDSPGLLLVRFHAAFCQAGSGLGGAYVFLNGAQAVIPGPANTTEALKVEVAGATNFGHLFTSGGGLVAEANIGTALAADLSAGQAFALAPTSAGTATHQGPGSSPIVLPVEAGEHTVSMRFSASANKAEAKFRRLYVEGIGF